MAMADLAEQKNPMTTGPKLGQEHLQEPQLRACRNQTIVSLLR